MEVRINDAVEQLRRLRRYSELLAGFSRGDALDAGRGQ
jgi:hypothetical protein